MTDINNKDLISVVIPCYNSGSTIRRTIDSIKKQTWKNIEIIVVDDGSTEVETLSILDSLNEVNIIRQSNRGLPAARNTGFFNAQGKYVLPLDADDWLESTGIEKLRMALRRNPNASFAFSYWQLHGEVSGVLKKGYNFFEQLFLNQIPYCILVPKKTWSDIGGYDETMRKGYEDWEFNIRLGSNGCFGQLIAEPLFNYQVSSQGMLLSQSSHIHGDLWTQVQLRNPKLYTPKVLYKTWKKWRREPSTYPLYVYFGWLILHKLLPSRVFAYLVNQLRTFSQSRRLKKQSKYSNNI